MDTILNKQDFIFDGYPRTIGQAKFLIEHSTQPIHAIHFAIKKELLIEQLRETLEQTSRKALMEASKDESEFEQEKLKKVPYPLYIG